MSKNVFVTRDKYGIIEQHNVFNLIKYFSCFYNAAHFVAGKHLNKLNLCCSARKFWLWFIGNWRVKQQLLTDISELSYFHFLSVSGLQSLTLL